MNKTCGAVPGFHDHVAALAGAHPDLAELIEPLRAAVAALSGAVRGGGKILAAGNGGSCADALHFSGELLKSFLRSRPLPPDLREALSAFPFGAALADSLQYGFPVVVLGQNPSLATAWLNDQGDARALFAQECCALVRPGDALVAFSTSGEAENLIWAMAVARARGARTVAFTARDGGGMGRMADVEVRAPARTTPRAQEQHLALYHALCAALEEEFHAP